MFSCEMCGNGLAINDVLTIDMNRSELCDGCVEILIEMNQVITASKFVGLK